MKFLLLIQKNKVSFSNFIFSCSSGNCKTQIQLLLLIVFISQNASFINAWHFFLVYMQIPHKILCPLSLKPFPILSYSLKMAVLFQSKFKQNDIVFRHFNVQKMLSIQLQRDFMCMVSREPINDIIVQKWKPCWISNK